MRWCNQVLRTSMAQTCDTFLKNTTITHRMAHDILKLICAYLTKVKRFLLVLYCGPIPTYAFSIASH